MTRQRPRVLVLTTTLPAVPGDGTPEFVLTMARRTRPAEVTVVAPRVRGCARTQSVDGIRLRRYAYAPQRVECLADDAIMPTLRARPATAWQLPGLVLGMIAATAAEVRAHRPDVLHAHWIVPGGLVAALVQSRTGIPFVVTAHGADAHVLGGRITRHLKRFVLRRATEVHAVSAEIAAVLDAIEPGCVTHVQHVGVDVDVLRAAAGDPRPTPGQLVFVGRLAEKKGVDVLLEALAVTNAPWRLSVIGDGPCRSLLQDRAETLGIADRITFAGRRSAAEVARSYAGAAAVVVPSCTASDGDRDGTPVVAMEALALGVPLIATDVGGMRDLIGDDAIPERSPAALAAAIDRVLADPEAAQRRARELRAATGATIDAARIGADLAARLSLIASPPPRTRAGASASSAPRWRRSSDTGPRPTTR